MRFHPPAKLPERVHEDLRARQEALNKALKDKRLTAKSRALRIDRAWSRWRSTSRDCVVRSLQSSASAGQPRERCVYCESDGGSTIDHVEPKAKNPTKTFVWKNMVWSCGPCNQGKLDATAMIVNPTAVDPFDHLMLSMTGAWIGLTQQGNNTVSAVRALDDEAMNRARCDALAAQERFLIEYVEANQRGDPFGADIFRNAILEGPFTDVFAATLRLYRDPVLQAFVRPAVHTAINKCPEILGWLEAHDAARRANGTAAVAMLAKRVRVRKRRR